MRSVVEGVFNGSTDQGTGRGFNAFRAPLAFEWRVRQTAAVASQSRKVRTPQDRELGNAQAGRPDGKCHRNQTADGRRAQARVKRWCKRPPASRETGMAGKPLPEQGQAEAPVVRRSSLGWTATRSGGNADPRWMAVARQGHRIRLTGGLAPSSPSSESPTRVPDGCRYQGEHHQSRDPGRASRHEAERGDHHVESQGRQTSWQAG